MLVGNYRKVHIPGTQEFDPERVCQQLEKRYFTPGDLGFPVWDVQGMKMGMAICNDRRWPESLRVLGLKGVDLVSIGYCTPVFNTQFPDKESAELRQFQSDLTMQAGAYHNSCFVVAAAKAGIEGGCAFQGGSLVVAPSGEILARASSTADELVVAQIDLLPERIVTQEKALAVFGAVGGRAGGFAGAVFKDDLRLGEMPP